jgi:hypothetical protein
LLRHQNGTFSLQHVNGCTVLRELPEPHTGALLITDAQQYDELPLLILQEYRKVDQTLEGLAAFFYKTGIEKRFLAVDGDVLDRQLYEVYFKSVFLVYAKDNNLRRNELNSKVDNFIRICLQKSNVRRNGDRT